jgi:hypothetical protein
MENNNPCNEITCCASGCIVLAVDFEFDCPADLSDEGMSKVARSLMAEKYGSGNIESIEYLDVRKINLSNKLKNNILKQNKYGIKRII